MQVDRLTTDRLNRPAPSVVAGAIRSAIIAMVLTLCGGGIAIGDTRTDVWPEVNFFHQINDRYRLHLLGAFVRARDIDYSDGQFGAHLDIGALPILRPWLLPDSNLYQYLWFRVGYRYGSEFTSDDPFDEHRVVLEMTGRFPLPGGVMLVDRSRGDLRFINGAYSSRYRNRVRVERPIVLFGRYAWLPYASAELFYDTRFDAINRFRYSVGIEIPIRQCILDLYYLRQADTRSEPAHSNVVGVSFNFFF
jgi:hypothetical protein